MQKNLRWTIVAALLAGFAGCGSNEVGMIAVYEVDTDKIPSKPKISVAEMERLSAAIDRRLTRGWHKLGTSRQLDAERIEVSIFRTDVEEMQRIADLLSRSGTLEFRILANDWDHRELIKNAQVGDHSRRLPILRSLDSKPDSGAGRDHGRLLATGSRGPGQCAQCG